MSYLSSETKQFDTHCHLDLYQNPADVVCSLRQEAVQTVAVTNTPSVFPRTERKARGNSLVWPALGLHPELAVERRGELPLFAEYLEKTRWVGEVGLDYAVSETRDQRIQRRVFDRILELCAQSGDKILTIHSRRAARDVVEAIGSDFPGKAILHWYSGSLTVLEQAVEYGFYFSVNPAMASSERFSPLVKRIPRERILTESDGPFVKVHGRAATPRDTCHVLGTLSSAWNEPVNQVGERLLENLRSLLGDSR